MVDDTKLFQCCQFDIPLGCISRVEKVGYSTVSRGEDSYGLEITCKVTTFFEEINTTIAYHYIYKFIAGYAQHKIHSPANESQ